MSGPAGGVGVLRGTPGGCRGIRVLVQGVGGSEGIGASMGCRGVRGIGEAGVVGESGG